MAYSNFDFDKPARVADVGVLDQNVDVPESLQRPIGKPSTLVSSRIRLYFFGSNMRGSKYT